MKKVLRPIALLLAFTLAITCFTITPEQANAAEATEKTVPIYRLYHWGNYEHLYTSDENEVSTLAEAGWEYEGVGWYAPTSGTAVYRLYNPVLNNHLYTTDLNEIKVLTTKDVWVMDNKGNPLFYSGGSSSIYRLYNSANPTLNGQHLLTTDANEYATLATKAWGSWTQEGVALYAKALGTASLSDMAYYAAGSSDITNTDSEYSIEADVTLSGSGTGYHAKLVVCTSQSAVSFGIQYDRWGVAPYTDQTTFLVENVANNNAGGQSYVRYGYAKKNTTYHLMLTMKSDGTCTMYVNGTKVGSVKNTDLTSLPVYLRVEGSARLEGDSVTATFSNIKLKGSGSYDAAKTWGTADFTTNASITSDASGYTSDGTGTVVISGSISGIGTQDWDSAYDKVSGIIQFVE